MTSKPETVILKIKVLKNENHSNSFLQFNDWLFDDGDSSVRNTPNPRVQFVFYVVPLMIVAATDYAVYMRRHWKKYGDKGTHEAIRTDIINQRG